MWVYPKKEGMWAKEQILLAICLFSVMKHPPSVRHVRRSLIQNHTVSGLHCQFIPQRKPVPTICEMTSRFLTCGSCPHPPPPSPSFFSLLFDSHDSAPINLECSEQATVVCVSKYSYQLLVRAFHAWRISISLLWGWVPLKQSRILISLWTEGCSRSSVFFSVLEYFRAGAWPYYLLSLPKRTASTRWIGWHRTKSSVPPTSTWRMTCCKIACPIAEPTLVRSISLLSHCWDFRTGYVDCYSSVLTTAPPACASAWFFFTLRSETVVFYRLWACPSE